MDTATTPQRYYAPPAEVDREPAPYQPVGRHTAAPQHRQPQSQAAYSRDGPGGLPDGVGVETTHRNIVVCTSANGGIGLSVSAAVIARRLTERDLSCALLDADFDTGGLDVLLGIEGEHGTRFETLDAPLGRLDGEALNRELPVWDNVRVLASNPWNGAVPDWWQTQAAVRALAESNRVLVVDAGRGDLLTGMPELGPSAQLVLVELTVLGLARAKRHIAVLKRWMRANQSSGDATASASAGDHPRRLMLLGIEPRGVSGRAGVVSLDEASDYLGRPIRARLRANAKLCSDVLSGLGIRALGRTDSRAIDVVCDWIDDLMAGGDAI